jgi:hypothetical protein
MAVDVVIGTATAVYSAARAHRPLLEAALRGAAGGAVMHGGKRIIGTRNPDVRLLGVQTVALGANMVRSASSADGWLTDLAFPLYPLVFRWRRGPDPDQGLTARLSLASLYGTAFTAMEGKGRFSLTESLRSGGPVFVADAATLDRPPEAEPGDLNSSSTVQFGQHMAGAILWARSSERSSKVLTHETVHLAQFVQDEIIFGLSASDRAWDHLATRQGTLGSAARVAGRFVVLDGLMPIDALSRLSAMFTSVPGDRYTEREAYFFAGEDLCAELSAADLASCRRW